MKEIDILDYIKKRVDEYYSKNNSLIKKSEKSLKQLKQEEQLRINLAIEESGILDIIAKALLEYKESNKGK